MKKHLLVTPTYKSYVASLKTFNIELEGYLELWDKFGDKTALLITLNDKENEFLDILDIDVVNKDEPKDKENIIGIFLEMENENKIEFDVKNPVEMFDTLSDYFVDSGAYWRDGRKIDLVKSMKSLSDESLYPLRLVYNDDTELVKVESYQIQAQTPGERIQDAIRREAPLDPNYQNSLDMTEPTEANSADWFLDFPADEIVLPMVVPFFVPMEEGEDVYSKEVQLQVAEEIATICEDYSYTFEAFSIEVKNIPGSGYGVHGWTRPVL